MGSYIWNGEKNYQSKIEYSCGPYGQFQAENGSFYNATSSDCQWDGVWSPPNMGQCRWTHCVGFPEPPASSNFNESATEYSFDNAEMYMGPDVLFPSSMPVVISNFSMADKIFVLEGRMPDELPGDPEDLLRASFTDNYGMEILSVTVDVRDSSVALSCAYNVS